MKKLAGYIASNFCFELGNLICKVSYYKRNGEFFFDRPRYVTIGMFLAEQYQRWMRWSVQIQDWAGNEGPWKNLENNENENSIDLPV